MFYLDAIISSYRERKLDTIAGYLVPGVQIPKRQVREAFVGAAEAATVAVAAPIKVAEKTLQAVDDAIDL